MSNEAVIDLVMYKSLNAQEENILREIENVVVNLLFSDGIKARPVWTSNLNNGKRFIQLALLRNSQLKVIFELSEDEFGNLSKNEIVSKLKNELKEI